MIDRQIDIDIDKSSVFKAITDDNIRVFKIAKMAVLLKYLSNFWIYLEMLLIKKM